MLAFVKEFRH